MKRPLAALAIVALLTACSEATPAVVEGQPTTTTPPVTTSETPTPTPTPLPTWRAADGPATWTCKADDGVVYRIMVPTAADNALVKRLENARSHVKGAERPHYLVIEADATKASGTAGLYRITWATEDAASVTADPITDTISAWRDLVTTDNVEVYNALVDLSNDLNRSNPVKGAKGTMLMVASAPITSMVAPTVYPDGFSQAPCELGA